MPDGSGFFWISARPWASVDGVSGANQEGSASLSPGEEIRVPAGTSRSSLKPAQAGDFKGKSTVVVLPVDPYLVYVYWRIEPSRLQQDAPVPGGEASGADPVLRFHSIAPVFSHLDESGEFFEVPVELDAPNWYVHLPKPSGRYLVELGLRAEDGRFTVLARSPLVQTPPESPSENDDEVLMLVIGDFVLPNPFPEHQEEQPLTIRPFLPAVLSRPENRSGPDSIIRRFPLPPPPREIPFVNLGFEQTIGLPLTEPGSGTGVTGSRTDGERRLTEWNEESFASGQSSVSLGKSC